MASIQSLDDFCFGRAPRPLHCGHGLVVGAGEVVPEINFTLSPMAIDETSWTAVRGEYQQMIDAVLTRALELQCPSLLVEFETLPDMTERPAWGLELCRLLADALERAHAKHGLRCALRFTPNDTREFERPPRMRGGRYWDDMQAVFAGAAGAGADLLAIESTGGKEIGDEALMTGDLKLVVFALGVLGARDMAFLWSRIVAACEGTTLVPSGDSACGFANTAMVLADRRMISRVFAAVVRVASVPRSLVAFEKGARGPSKDCAYEGPYLKALAGVPISMEGRTAACAHLSPVGNISQALCDCWSNESVHNVQLLSGKAPVVSLEQLVYDCRLMNTASAGGSDGARLLRDWLTESDAGLDPQAWVLRPDVVLRICRRIEACSTAYLRTREAVLAALEELAQAHAAGSLGLPRRELAWLERLRSEAEQLPVQEAELVDEVLASATTPRFRREDYAL
jgi:methanol---5-hydroxybenzimidazolylcobamide Co-methyltransferase